MIATTARRRALPPLVVLALALLALALLTVTPPPAIASAADGDVQWSVQPSSPKGPGTRDVFEFQVPPGTTISDWVAVTNRGKVPATVRVYGADATADYASGAFTLIGADSASTDLGAWTSVDKASSSCKDTNDQAEAACAIAVGKSITLKPGQQANLPFTITVPKDATTGDHAGGIVAGMFSGGAQEGTSVRQETRVGARVYLRVDGALSPGIGVRGATAGFGASLVPFAPGTATVNFDVVNSGNTRLNALPQVTLKGPFGIPLATATLDPIKNLVPGATTHITAPLPKIAPLLLLFAEASVTPQAADGAAAGDPMPAPAHTSMVTWAVPWTGLLAVALVAGLVWTLRWRHLRRQERIAEELAELMDSARAGSPGAAAAVDPEPAGVGFVPRTTARPTAEHPRIAEHPQTNEQSPTREEGDA